MVLTEEQLINIYPAATLEGTYNATGTQQQNSMVNYEKGFYNIDNTKILAESSIPSWVAPPESAANTKLYYNNNGNPPSNTSYPANSTPAQTAGSGNVYKLNPATGGKTTGLEFMIKVMAGDHIDIFGKSYYLNTATVSNSNATTLNVLSLFTNLLLAPSNAVSGKGVTATQLNTLNSNLVPSTFFRGSNNEAPTTVPKAYINYIFLDEQFKYAGAGNFSRVGVSGTVKEHWYTDAVQLQNISVPKNGYIFVYVSNESNLDVFFDNLQVIHKPGPILEETHYYPFGLTMAGISSKSAGGLENKKKYNGIEFDSTFGINEYEAELRNLDPALGRWWQIDPETEDQEMWSPYASNFDNPILYKDPRGNKGEGCCDGFLDGLSDLVDNALLSVNGVVLGAVNTLSFGLISSDPFNISDNLTSKEQMYFDNARTAGKIAPLLFGAKQTEVTPELVNVKIPNRSTSEPVQPSSTKVEISNTKIEGTPSTNTKPATPSKVQKSTQTERVGNFTKKTKIEPSKKSPGQSRAEYVTYKNKDGKTIRTHKDSYDRGNKFQGRKPLRGGPEGRTSE